MYCCVKDVCRGVMRGEGRERRGTKGVYTVLESFLLAGVNPIYTLEQAWSQTERGSQIDIAPKRGHGGCFIRGCELSARHDTQLGYEQSGDDDLLRSIINCEEGSEASAYLITCPSIEVERRRTRQDASVSLLA